MQIYMGEETDWLEEYVGALFECEFEEKIDIPLSFPRWFEAEAGTTLFYFGIDPFEPEDYGTMYEEDIYGVRHYEQWWGMGAGINEIRSSYAAIPVSVASSSEGFVGVVPRQVVLTLMYFQRLKGTKRLVLADIAFPPDFQCHTYTNNGEQQQEYEASGIPQCETDINGAIATSEYQLEIVYRPFGWFALLNQFQFDQGIYIIGFILSGLIAIVSGVFVWGLNRLLTRLRHPPHFHFSGLLYNMAFPVMFGATLAGVVSCCIINVAH
jgi:hypothetical protein